MALNNQELIYLDTLIYYNDLFVTIQNSAGNYTVADAANYILDTIDSTNPSYSAMSNDEWKGFANKILEDENLSNYFITNTTLEKDEYGINAAVFVDDLNNPQDANVIYRGTSSDVQWDDNGQGMYLTDSNTQKNALQYVNDIPYDHITVSGHSKGGNLSQYVTITSDKVDNCLSVDGQGFSEEFVNKYQEDIAEKKGKITSLSNRNDLINVLGIQIAGTDLCYAAEEERNVFDFYYNHVPINVLDKNFELRDENIAPRNPMATYIGDVIVDVLKGSDGLSKKLIADAAMTFLDNYYNESEFEFVTGIVLAVPTILTYAGQEFYERIVGTQPLSIIDLAKKELAKVVADVIVKLAQLSVLTIAGIAASVGTAWQEVEEMTQYLYNTVKGTVVFLKQFSTDIFDRFVGKLFGAFTSCWNSKKAVSSVTIQTNTASLKVNTATLRKRKETLDNLYGKIINNWNSVRSQLSSLNGTKNDSELKKQIRQLEKYGDYLRLCSKYLETAISEFESAENDVSNNI